MSVNEHPFIIVLTVHNRFLIEGAKGAVLHTGDFRAEPWFLESLTHNPFLQPYLASPDPPHETAHPSPLFPPYLKSPVVKTLTAIYLDTASIFTETVVPTKVLENFLCLTHGFSYHLWSLRRVF